MKLALVLALVATAACTAHAFNATLAKELAVGELTTAKRAAMGLVSGGKPAVNGQGLKNFTTTTAYVEPGPCTPLAPITGSVQAPLKDGKNATLSLFLTLPSACAAGRGRSAPWPVAMLYSGWSLAAEPYASYANHLASWGYAVLQYNVPTTANLTPDAIELTFLPRALAWASSVAPVFTNAILVAGHSRGGRVAADLYCAPPAGTPTIAAAALIDPTDNDYTSPESALYPSGLKACAAAGKPPMSIIVSGLPSFNCKFAGGVDRAWLAVAGAGSWYSTVLKASHTAFISSSNLLDETIAGAFCVDVPTAVSHHVAAATAAGQITAWFDARLQPPDSQLAANQAAWLAWTAAQSAWFAFEVKP